MLFAEMGTSNGAGFRAGGKEMNSCFDLESLRCLQDIQEWVAVYMHLELRGPKKKERRVPNGILRSDT